MLKCMINNLANESNILFNIKNFNIKHKCLIRYFYYNNYNDIDLTFDFGSHIL